MFGKPELYVFNTHNFYRKFFSKILWNERREASKNQILCRSIITILLDSCCISKVKTLFAP